MIEPKETIFSDLPLSFIAHPVTGNVNLVKNENSIKQSVKAIVLTNFYERPYYPRFGGNLITKLFDNMDGLTNWTIEDDIRLALKNEEPRAEVHTIRVGQNDDRNTINVTVIFRPINSTELESVEVILERVR